MKYGTRLLATATMLLIVPLAGCVTTAIQNDVPQCELLIPGFLLAPTTPAEQPVSAKLPDGHDDARPWQAGFVEQTGKLEQADQKAPAVDHIYRWCLDIHRQALKRSQRGFFTRIFG